jgi:hypothetical protein
MPQDNDKPSAVPRRSELNAADQGGSDDIAGHADDEEISDSLVEDDFGRHA